MEAQQSRKFSKVSAIRLTQGAATLSVGMNTTVSILTRLYFILSHFVLLRLAHRKNTAKHGQIDYHLRRRTSPTHGRFLPFTLLENETLHEVQFHPLFASSYSRRPNHLRLVDLGASRR